MNINGLQRRSPNNMRHLYRARNTKRGEGLRPGGTGVGMEIGAAGKEGGMGLRRGGWCIFHVSAEF